MDANDVKLGMKVKQVEGEKFFGDRLYAQITAIANDQSGMVRLSTGCFIHTRFIEPLDENMTSKRKDQSDES